MMYISLQISWILPLKDMYDKRCANYTLYVGGILKQNKNKNQFISHHHTLHIIISLSAIILKIFLSYSKKWLNLQKNAKNVLPTRVSVKKFQTK